MILFVPQFAPKEKGLLPAPQDDRWGRFQGYFKDLFWVSFVALFVTLPVTVQHFYLFTPLSVIANLIVVPVSFFLFFIGSFYLLLAPWLPANLLVLIAPMQWLMRVFAGSLHWCENLPGSYYIVGRLSWIYWSVLAGGTVYLLASRSIRSRWIRASCVVLLASAVFMAQDISRHFHRVFKVTVLDVGQGDAIYFEFPQGGNLLVDTGKGGDSNAGKRHVAPFLKSKGVRSIDTLVISHPQEDHIGGLPYLLDEFSVRSVIDSKRDYPSKLYAWTKTSIAREDARYLRAGSGDELLGYKDIRIRFLHPPRNQKPSKDVNDDSLVMKISYGETDVLMTGDLREKGMRLLLESGADLDAEILKVPHHGGKTHPTVGSAFFRAVSPQISVVSSGQRNPFGHPRAETLELLSQIPGNLIYRTDQRGAAQISSDGRRIHLELS